MKTSMLFILALAAGLLFASASHAQAPAEGASATVSAEAGIGIEPTAPAASPTAPVAPTAPATAAPPPTAPATATPPPAAPKKRISGKKVALIITGWTIFGVTWIPALIWGAYSATEYAPSAVFIIPCFGPIIVGVLNFTASSIWGSSSGSKEVTGVLIGLGIFFVVWGLVQGTGLALAITGHVIKSQPAQAKLKKFNEKFRRAGVTLAPLATKESMGLGLAGWF
jgi:hypothetical protein